MPIDSVEGTLERCCRCVDQSQAGAEDAGVGSGAEQGDAQSVRGDAIAMTPGDCDDEPAQSKPAKVVADLALRELSRVEAQQWGQKGPKIFCLKSLWLDAEQHQDREQSLDAGIVKAKSGDALIADAQWAGQLFQSLETDHAVMSDLLDVKETSVG